MITSPFSVQFQPSWPKYYGFAIDVDSSLRLRRDLPSASCVLGSNRQVRHHICRLEVLVVHKWGLINATDNKEFLFIDIKKLVVDSRGSYTLPNIRIIIVWKGSTKFGAHVAYAFRIECFLNFYTPECARFLNSQHGKHSSALVLIFLLLATSSTSLLKSLDEVQYHYHLILLSQKKNLE